MWRALVRALGGLGSRRYERIARALGCSEHSARGDVLERGGTIAGFRAASARAPAELALVGEHRFSRYSLTFRLQRLGDDSTRIAAETRAVFPGRRGSAYRALVIGTGGHVFAVRRLLRRVRRAAERPEPT